MAFRSCNGYCSGRSAELCCYDDNGNPSHSAFLSPGQSIFTITGILGGKSLGGKTQVTSKNGDQNIDTDTTIKDLQALYGNDIKIFLRK